jgi:hypothetical protein
MITVKTELFKHLAFGDINLLHHQSHL